MNNEYIELLASIWNTGTRDDRLEMSHIPLTLNKEEFEYFGTLLTRMWCIHYFENGFE